MSVTYHGIPVVYESLKDKPPSSERYCWVPLEAWAEAAAKAQFKTMVGKTGSDAVSMKWGDHSIRVVHDPLIPADEIHVGGVVFKIQKESK